MSSPETPLNYAGLNYLQSVTEISYAYAPSFLTESGKREATYETDLLAFAPTFGGNATTTGRSILEKRGLTDLRSIAGLNPLQHNRPEVKEICRLVGDSEAYARGRSHP